MKKFLSMILVVVLVLASCLLVACQDSIYVTDISKTGTVGLQDTYTITYSDGTTANFVVTNGAQGQQGIQGVQGEQGIQGPQGIQGEQGLQGIQGIQGVPGKDGKTPVVEIKNGNWWIDGVDTGISALAPQPNNPFAGKTISIMGDSISTYQGYIPTGNARYYPAQDVDNVNETWWMSLINDFGAKLGINESWSGSTVHHGQDATNGHVQAMAGMTRINKLDDNGTPDLILFYGGTNDINRSYVQKGDFDPTQNYTLDTTSTTWSDFADAYKDAVMRIQHTYPKAKLVCLLPAFSKGHYTQSSLNAYCIEMVEICDYFGVEYIDLRKCGINYGNMSLYMNDGIHPNEKGMQMFKEYIKAQLQHKVTFVHEEVDYSTLTYVAFGDSITEGYDGMNNRVKMDESYPELVGHLLDFKTVDNRGRSGSTFCVNDYGVVCMTERILAFEEDADVISVMLGVNDYIRSLPLGKREDFDKTTVYGCMNLICDFFVKNYKDSYIFFMTPFKAQPYGVHCSVDNDAGYNLQDVADAITEIAVSYGFSVLDMFSYGNYESEMVLSASDGLHPSKNFYINYTAPQIANFISNNYN